LREPAGRRCHGCGRVDPADIAVGTAVHDVDLIAAGITEHEDRAVLGVEFDDGAGDRHGLQGYGGFRDDRRGVVLRHFLVLIRHGRHDAVGDVLVAAVAGAVVGSELALITAQPRLDALGSRFESRLRVVGLARRLQAHAGVEEDNAVGRKTWSRFLNGHMAGKSAIKVFFDRLPNPPFDTRPECFADLHVFSRYPQAHLFMDLPCSDSGRLGVYTRGRQAQASQRPQGRFLVRTFRLITSRLQTVFKRPCLWLVPCGRASSHFISECQ
jgi:hypothetical protein